MKKILSILSASILFLGMIFLNVSHSQVVPKCGIVSASGTAPFKISNLGAGLLYNCNTNTLYSTSTGGGGSATNTLTGNNANNSLTLSDTNGNSTSTVVQVGEVYRKSTSTISFNLNYSISGGGFNVTSRNFDVVGGITSFKQTYTQSITATQNSNVFTITGTLPATMVAGNYIEINNTAPIYKIVSISGNNVTVNRNYTGATQTFTNYEVFYRIYSSMVTNIIDSASYKNAFISALNGAWTTLNPAYNLSFGSTAGLSVAISGIFNATNSVPSQPLGEIYVIDTTPGLTIADANYILYNQNQNNPPIWSPSSNPNAILNDIIFNRLLENAYLSASPCVQPYIQNKGYDEGQTNYRLIFGGITNFTNSFSSSTKILTSTITCSNGLDTLGGAVYIATTTIDIAGGGGGGGNVSGEGTPNYLAIWNGTTSLSTSTIDYFSSTTEIAKLTLNGAKLGYSENFFNKGFYFTSNNYNESAGQLNTVFGNNTLSSQTNAIGTTAFGQSCLFSLESGTGNSCYGNGGLNSLLRGDGNTAFGESSLPALQGGNRNIGIGQNTNVLLLNADDQLNIGNWIYGNQGNFSIGSSTAPYQTNAPKFQVEGATTLNGDVVITGINFKATSSILASTGNNPRQITMDSQGNIYTANTTAANVSKITPSGYSVIIGTTGANPNGIAVDSAGNVYTANVDASTISKITQQGVSTVFASTPSPWGLTIDTSGNLYTTNYFNNTVTKISPAGVTQTIGTTGANPYAILVDNSGNVYTTNYSSSSVSKITPGGVSSILGTTGVQPDSITIDNNGNIYTTNNGDGNVTKITPAGVSSIFSTTGGRPRGITIDTKGNLYVSVLGVTTGDPDIIYTINTKTGQKNPLIPSTTGIDPVGLVIDTNGILYSANFGSANVSKIVQPYYSQYLTTDAFGNVIYSSSTNIGNINDSEITIYTSTSSKPNAPVLGTDFNITSDGKLLTYESTSNLNINSLNRSSVIDLGNGVWLSNSYDGSVSNTFYRSVDKGITWNTLFSTSSSSSFGLGQYNVSFLRNPANGAYPDTIFLAGVNTLLKSIDNGLTWNTISGTGISTLGGVNELTNINNSSNIFACGGASGLSLSTDNGTNWSVVSPLNCLDVLVGNQIIYLATQGNGIMYSLNSGLTFSSSTITSGNIRNIAQIGGNSYIATANTGVWLTKDSLNWTRVNTNSSLNDITYKNGVLYAFNISDQKIYTSSDLGQTFSLLYTLYNFPAGSNTNWNTNNTTWFMYYRDGNLTYLLDFPTSPSPNGWKASSTNATYKSTIRFTNTGAGKYSTIVGETLNYAPVGDLLLDVTDSTTTNSTRIQSKNKQNTCVGNTLNPEVVCAKIDVVPTFYQTAGLGLGINRSYYNPKNGYYMYSTLNNGIFVNFNPKVNPGYQPISNQTIFGSASYSIGDMIFAPNGELFVIGYFAQNVLVSKLTFSAGTIQPTTVKISQVITPTGSTGFSYQSIQDLAVLQTGTDLYTIGFVGTTLNPNDNYLVKAVDLNTTGTSIVASNTRNYFNGATYGYTFWNAIEFDTTGRLTLAGNTRIISYYAGQTPVEIWRNPDLTGPTNQDIYSDGTSVYWAVSDGNIYHTTYANPTTDLFLYPKTTTSNTGYSNVYGIGLDASSTLYQMFYGARNLIQDNYFVNFSKNDTTSISGVLDLSSTTKIVNLDTFIPAPIKRMSIFSVTETTSTTGSTIFAIGTRGGAVTTLANNVNIQPPTINGTSNWVIPAGIWDITVSANYIGTSQGLETVITKFGIDSNVTGAGNANNLYFTPSKTQTGGDAIAGTHEQFFNFSVPTTFYLTRFAGVTSTVGTSQISPNNDFQISFSKLD